MASLPSDRTKLALAQSNQVAGTTASSSRNINSITELYDTIDLLFQTLQTYQAGTRYNVNGGSFTDTVFATTIDGGTFV